MRREETYNAGWALLILLPSACICGNFSRALRLQIVTTPDGIYRAKQKNRYERV